MNRYQRQHGAIEKDVYILKRRENERPGNHRIVLGKARERDICHCGEIDQQGIKPREDAIDLYSIKRPGIIQPFTWEGCVVKIADKIAYLGRDIEDARQYHILNMSAYRNMREIVTTTLNGKNSHAFRSGRAVNTTVLINDLIVDLINQSSPEKGLCFSDEYFKFIKG